jgi:asparagine synthase (glutamine-hydrolysing)
VRGNSVAVAPNLFALAGLDWIDNTIDEAGLLFPMGRADVRAGRGDSTMLKDVLQLEAGSSVVIEPDRVITKSTAHILIEQPQWRGNYADAVEETATLLRSIMRTKLARHSKIAPMLSGGLDSSILTWLCARECGPDTDLQALTSVAPTGSGIADEAPFSNLVAQTLGIKSRHVFPAHDINIYQPPEYILTGGSGPILSNRHCLTDAFQIAAKDVGATLIIDGTYGEMTATARLHSNTPFRQLRKILGRLARATTIDRLPKDETTPFHVRLAPHRLANLPEPIRAALNAPPVNDTWLEPNGLFGYMPGIEKALAHPNEFYPGAVRMIQPYRDIRLLRLFAGFPMQMLTQNAADRGIGRSMLAGQLPDSIRLRSRGMPASPDHLSRLQRQAHAARQRIPRFRKAEVDDWIDLDWLDLTLESVAARGPINYNEANEVQLTAIAAEFLLWWRSQN